MCLCVRVFVGTCECVCVCVPDGKGAMFASTAVSVQLHLQ